MFGVGSRSSLCHESQLRPVDQELPRTAKKGNPEGLPFVSNRV